MRIINHIPEDILDIPNVEALAKVFSELQDYKNVEISKLYHYLVNDGLASNEAMRKTVINLLSMNVPEEVTRTLLRNLIQVADTVLNLRGTQKATTLFLRALTGGFVVNNSYGYYSSDRSQILLLNDDFNGYFPSEQDIDNLFNDGNEKGIYYLYFEEIYDGTLAMSYNLGIVSPYSKYEDFRKWVSESFVLHVKKNELDSERFKFFFFDYEFPNLGLNIPVFYDTNPANYE